MSVAETGEARRLVSSDYFAEATRILARGSHQDLTIQALCDALKVSKGSFYHHFGSFAGFVEAFLEEWEREMTLNIRIVVDRSKTTRERHDMLASYFHKLPHDAESAIRVWARTDSVVQDVLARVDRERIEMLADTFAQKVSSVNARKLSELYHLVLIGAQFSERPVSAKRVQDRIKAIADLTIAKYGSGVFGLD